MAFVPPTFNVPPAAPASEPPAPDAATEPAGPAPEDQAAAAEPEQTARVKVGDLVQHSYVDSYDQVTEHQLVGHVVDVTDDADPVVVTVAWSTGGRAALPVDDLEVL